ncbi:hypothetical protein C8J57DRAFT_1520200 [Mycena rebaudengoi]|nr:hypothetical protein C8J57DRAFT_1520200 [Mycena rebaudengoi]
MSDMRLYPDMATCGYVAAQTDALNLRMEEKMTRIIFTASKTPETLIAQDRLVFITRASNRRLNTPGKLIGYFCTVSVAPKSPETLISLQPRAKLERD